MKAKSPLKRQKFDNNWDEIEYLYQKLLYWLYEREDAAKAAAFADRLEQLLSSFDPRHESILEEECWSLIYESKGDVAKAIEHRENEIRLMRRLHELAGDTACNSFALEGRGFGHLSDRLDLLATLYHDRGDVDRALSLLRESKQLCEEHGIEFDAEDVLEAYAKEKGAR